jgi:tripartite-type tricarboxylate transporter receptor subunit TctC
VTLTLAAASFTTRAGLQMPQLPYSGDTVALKDLMAGKVQLQFAGAGAAREHIISGKLRALAVSSATGVPALADIPNISNFIPGYDVNAWLGIGAPRGIASDIVERMSKEISSGLADPSVKAQLADSAHVPMPMTPAEFGKFIAYETEKFRKLIESTGVKRR